MGGRLLTAQPRPTFNVSKLFILLGRKGHCCLRTVSIPCKHVYLNGVLLAEMSTEEWVAGSLVRDQDLTVDVSKLSIILGRIASMGGDRNQYIDKARHSPGYLSVSQ